LLTLARPLGAPALPAGASTSSNQESQIAQTQPANIATAQVVVGTSATLVAAARVDRNTLIVMESGGSGSAAVYYGPAGVTVSTGFTLGTGAPALLLPYSGDLYAVVAASTQTVTVIEIY
jgi:hypothetical protein